MKATKGQMRSGFTLVELLVVISIIVVLAGLAVPTAMKALGKAEQVTGINNVKGIKSALDLFAGDFDGEYPSDTTGEEIMELQDDNVGGGSRSGGGRLERSGGLERGSLGDRGNRMSRDSGSSGKSSNYYFTQLMGHGLDNEELFYQKTFKKAFILKKPDNNAKVDEGENVWGYTKNLQQTSSSHIPIVFDTPVSTGDQPKFSKKVWDGKIIVAKLDSSTRTEMISGSDKSSGTVRVKVGGERMNLFSPESLEEGIMTTAELRPLRGGN